MVKRLMQYPHAALQAMHVKKTAMVLPEPEGKRIGQSGVGKDISLLVLGDSSAAGVGVSNQNDALTGQLVSELAEDHRVSWQLIAQSGATTGWAREVLLQENPLNAQFVVVALGVNDVKNGVPLRVWQARIQQVLDLLADRHGASGIYWSALPPMGRFPLLPDPLRQLLGQRSDRFDAALRGLLERHPAGRHLPLDLDLDESHMASDGFHPGPLIYKQWAQKAADMIRDDQDLNKGATTLLG